MEGQVQAQTVPTIRVESDYDGYFESLVRSWLPRKNGEFKHKEIVISAGPWRSYAVAFEKKGDTIELDFYSALRTGFGSLGDDEIRDLIEHL